MTGEKDKFDVIYPSSEKDLVDCFELSPDILNVHEDNEGLVTIRHSRPASGVENYFTADLKWSKQRGETPFYPTLRSMTPKDFIEISFMKDGYTVTAYNLGLSIVKTLPNKEERVSEIMDIIKRGMQFIDVFRNIPINLRADIRNRYIRILDCKLNGTNEPTLDCLSLTLRAIDTAKRGNIKEIIES